MTGYHMALYQCGFRYRDMLAIKGNTIKDHDVWKFNLELMDGCIKQLPVPKLCRWLGYIQGCLIERGYTTVQAERDWTRPLFRPLDFN